MGPRRKFRKRKLWGGIAILLLSVFLWSAWYVNTKGFSRKWRNYINSEFREYGLEVAIHRLTLDPFRGLVARNVQFFPYEEASRPTGEIGEIALDVDIGRLIQGKDFLNAIDLRRTDLTIPLAEDEPPLVIRNLSARISLPQDEIIIRELDARVLNIQIRADGRITTSAEASQEFADAARQEDSRPARFREESPGYTPLQLAWWPALRQELLRYQAAGKPPELKLDFSGTWGQPDSLRILAQLRGTGLQRGELPLDRIEALAIYEARQLSLKEFHLHSGKSHLRADAHFQLRGDAPTGSFQLGGTFDPLLLLREVLPPDSILREISFQDPPLLTLAGTLKDPISPAHLKDLEAPRPRLLVIGKLASREPVFRGEEFEELKADFAYSDGRWMVQGLRLDHPSGMLTGTVRVLPGDARAEVESTLSQRALTALLGAPAARWSERLDLTRSPEIRLSSRGHALTPEGLVTSGTLTLPRFTYAGVPFLSASCRLLRQAGNTQLNDLQLRREEGEVTGRVEFEHTGLFRMHHVHSTVNFRECLPLLGPTIERFLRPYALRGAPTIQAQGTLPRPGEGLSDVSLSINAPQGLDASLFGKVLPVDSAAADITYRGGYLTISSLQSQLLGGAADLNLRVMTRRGGQDLQGDLAVRGVDYRSLNALYMNNPKAEGVLNGHMEFQSPDASTSTLSGAGRATVTSQNVFSLAFLGSLSSLLDNTIGFGASKARELELDFVIRQGVIHGEKLEIRSSGYSLMGSGQYDLLRRRVDANVRVNMRGGPGLLLYPVSKLMEFTASGTLQDPNWRPKNFSRPPREDSPAPAPRAPTTTTP